jgi:AGCS family alanine or glycine:cation symporter
MDLLKTCVIWFNNLVWGPPMLIMIMGTGFYLMLRLGFMPLLRIPQGFVSIWQGRHRSESELGIISPFQALMTCLAATVGTGNIVGVATAIFWGGPGALFWMWCTALIGMATKYSEVVLAVHFREQDKNGDPVGGPMYAIQKGLGPRWKWLAVAFAIFGGLAGFGIGNMVQVNSMAQALNASFSINIHLTGVVTMLIIAVVILGGIRRIGKVAASLVPAMCAVYILAALAVLAVNFSAIPEAFRLIFSHAFTPIAATGGFAGAAVAAAIRFGVARGIFSNEAGLGTAGIIQAAGTNANPVRAGLVGMMGTFIDTIIVCTMTGLVIITSGVWTSGKGGAELSVMAFDSAIPGVGGFILTISLVLFAFTTILGWSYIGERCWSYLLGVKTIWPFRVLWVVAVYFGAIAELDFVWLLADTLNGLMAIPNLLGLLLLSPVVVQLTRQHFRRKNDRPAAAAKSGGDL